MRKAAPLLIALLVLALTPSTGAAATTTVTMNESYSFSPSTATVNTRGGKIRWKSNAVASDHDVIATAPYALFKSGGAGSIGPGDQYTRVFRQAGAFPYTCRIHAGQMSGTIKVPIGVTKLTGPVRFKVIVASEPFSASSDFENRIQIKRPGQGWALWKVTRNTYVNYKPTTHGTYQFRSAVQRVSDSGDVSGYSDPKSVSY